MIRIFLDLAAVSATGSLLHHHPRHHQRACNQVLEQTGINRPALERNLRSALLGTRISEYAVFRDGLIALDRSRLRVSHLQRVKNSEFCGEFLSDP